MIRKYILSGLACACALSLPSSAARADLFSGPYGPGGTWNVYEPVFTTLNFTDARNAALARPAQFFTSGRLASANSQAENDFLQRIARVGGSAWIGLTDDAAYSAQGTAEGGDLSGAAYPAGNAVPGPGERGFGYVWVDSGQKLTYQNWGGGEPNNSGGAENAGHIRGDFGWNDLPVTSTVPAYIVEYPTGLASNPLVAPQFIQGPNHGVGAWGIREVQDNSPAVSDIPSAVAALSSPSPGAVVNEYGRSTINFRDNGGGGHFGNDYDFVAPDNHLTENNNNIAILATGKIRVTAADNYTFGVNSDDGFRLTIDGQAFQSSSGATGTQIVNGSLQFPNGRGADDSFGTVYLPAGDHKVQLVYWEGAGGDAVEVFAAQGAKTGFDATFSLIGAPPPTRNAGTITGNHWDVYEIHNNNGNLASAIADYNTVRLGGTVGGTTTHVNAPTLNFIDPDPNAAGANRGNDVAFPGNTAGVDDDHFAVGARANLTITPAQAGNFTFLILADDSSRFRILDSSGNPVAIVTSSGANIQSVDTNADGILDAFTNDGGCCSDIFGTYNLAAGAYTVEAIMNEQGGGASFELWAAFGQLTSFSNQFQLLGANNFDVIPGGLELVPEPSSFVLGGLGIVALVGLARRKRNG